jgi:hypothetical protein
MTGLDQFCIIVRNHDVNNYSSQEFISLVGNEIIFLRIY